MKLRGQSQLGWGLLQMLGEQSLPFVTTDAQRQAVTARLRKMNRAGAGTDSSTGERQQQTRNPSPAPNPAQNFTVVFFRCGHIYRKYPAARPGERRLDHDCAECAFPTPGEKTYAATLEDAFCDKLEACHCASPSQAMGEMRWLLQCFASRDSGAVPMVARYYLDARGLIEHGSSLHAAWLTKEGEELLDWLRAERVDPVPFGVDPDGPFANWRRCACSRLVPSSDWIEQHGCCVDCWEPLHDDWRATVVDNDRDRLIDDSRD